MSVALGILCFWIPATPQSASGRYESKFENDLVSVFALQLAPGGSAPAFESDRDTIWLAISDGAVRFTRPQQGANKIGFQSGDARFFPSFEIKQVSNAGDSDFRADVVVLKRRALVPHGCECVGNTANAICGCSGGGHLDSLWAFNLGELTLAGTSLAAGEGFRAAPLRDDMLLVAVTDIELQDEAAEQTASGNSQSPTLSAKAGDAVWVKGGRHQFKNASSQTARFVTIEF